jgi:staphylococcal nuclease domain-containing protein 1
VFVTEVTPEFQFYVQLIEQGEQLELLMEKTRQELTANPPLAGAYTPKRGDICAAKYTRDGLWYRTRVEKITGSEVDVFYIDYGNRETVDVLQCAALPSVSAADNPYAHEYGLACIQLPKDVGTM